MKSSPKRSNIEPPFRHLKISAMCPVATTGASDLFINPNDVLLSQIRFCFDYQVYGLVEIVRTQNPNLITTFFEDLRIDFSTQTRLTEFAATAKARAWIFFVPLGNNVIRFEGFQEPVYYEGNKVSWVPL